MSLAGKASREHTSDIYPLESPAADPYSDIQTEAEQLDSSQQNNLHIFMPRTVPHWKNCLLMAKTVSLFPIKYRPGSNHARKRQLSAGRMRLLGDEGNQKIWGRPLRMPWLCACSSVSEVRPRRRPVIDRWGSSDATHNSQQAIDSLSPKLACPGKRARII